MMRWFRLAMILCLALAALPSTAPPVQADPPLFIHSPFPLYGTQTFVGACPFPVRQTVIGSREVATLQVDSNGVPRQLQIRGKVDVLETNLNTGKTLEYSFSTPVDLVIDPVAGTRTFTSRGRALFFVVPSPMFPLPPGSPPAGATLTHGLVELVLPLGPGNIISRTTTGQTEDLCALLS